MKNNNNKQNKPVKFAVLATDVLLFSFYDNELLVKLIKINRPPYFKNIWGFPGGLVKPKETAEQAVARIVFEKAGLAKKSLIHLEQLYTFSDIDRDPRGRVVSVAYFGCLSWPDLQKIEKTNNSELKWSSIKNIDKLAYDHNQMLKVGLERLKSKVAYSTIISKLIAREFTLTDLETTMEIILERKIDKRNFRKKILKLNVIKETGDKKIGFKSRPAKLYRFISNKIINIELI